MTIHSENTKNVYFTERSYFIVKRLILFIWNVNTYLSLYDQITSSKNQEVCLFGMLQIMFLKISSSVHCFVWTQWLLNAVDNTYDDVSP